MTKHRGSTKAKTQRLQKGSKSQTFRTFHASKASTHAQRSIPDGKSAGFFRNASTIRRLNMYRSKPDLDKMKMTPTKPARIQPDRRWFGNTRVITSQKLQGFRQNMQEAAKDPMSVVLKRSQLPLSLIKEGQDEGQKPPRVNLLAIESFQDTFGKNKKRKRPKLQVPDIEAMMQKVETDLQEKEAVENTQPSLGVSQLENHNSSQFIFKKGTSRRIWGELYKVIDSSDVIVQVLDARNPQGTRCLRLEKHMKKYRTSKHVFLLLNKCDLVPAWVTSGWIRHLSKEYPTVAFHASINRSFGKNTLIQLLRQYAQLLKDRKQISVGFIGYPNVGKSSIINTLKHQKVCKAAPVPGETRVWQYINLTNRIYLIDCPGIVPSDDTIDDDTSKVLKGAIRAERIEAPEQHIDGVLKNVAIDKLVRRYNLSTSATWSSAEQFLKLVAMKMGKLLKKGEPDIPTAARIVLYDYQRGRLPYFNPPPVEQPQGDKEPVHSLSPSSQPIPNDEMNVVDTLQKNDLSSLPDTLPETQPIDEELSNKKKSLSKKVKKSSAERNQSNASSLPKPFSTFDYNAILGLEFD